MVADAVLEKEYVTSTCPDAESLLIQTRKAKQLQANEIFGHAFSWMSAIDAVADVYNGVSQLSLKFW